MLYLAYGSNLNKEQMGWRCPTATPYGRGMIDGYELVFRRTYLTIEPRKGGSVPVGVWDVGAPDIAALDRYEGYPRFYHKRDIVIPVDNGEYVRRRRCFVYIMNNGYQVEPPRGAYVECCRQGYADFGLDLSYLDEAIKKTLKIIGL